MVIEYADNPSGARTELVAGAFCVCGVFATVMKDGRLAPHNRCTIRQPRD